MTKEEYKTILLSKGFILDHTQRGFPGRGEEDVYKHPDFKYNFYVTRIRKENDTVFGLITTIKNGKILEDIHPPNDHDTFVSNKTLFIWSGSGFLKLMEDLDTVNG